MKTMISEDSVKKEFGNYIKRMAEIRSLSSPPISGIENAEDYSKLLRDNFRKIGEMADENKSVVDRIIMPLFFSEDRLTDEMVETMMSFGESLVYAEECENLDLPIMLKMTERLLKDSSEKEDEAALIRQRDAEINTIYAMMNMTDRIVTERSISDSFRSRGFEIGRFFLGLLQKEKFAAIKEQQLREIVLTNARYSAVFYENLQDGEETNEQFLDLIDQMMAVSEDPFYHDLVPGFDWLYFRYRTLEYAAFATDYNNRRCFSEAQLERIHACSVQLDTMLKENQEYFREMGNKDYIPFLLARNRHLTGRLSTEEYHQELNRIFKERTADDFSVNGLFVNLLLPLEYLLTLDREHLQPQEKEIMKSYYDTMLFYAFRMSNGGSFSFLLEILTNVIRNYIEIPGGRSFEEMGMQCLAALHPPTFIHSSMVSKLSRTFCRLLTEKQPELFIGMPGYENKEDVLSKKDELIEFTGRAALCHDAGKMLIIDTIFVYGRNLFDSELEIIKTHPKSAAELLSRFDSTSEYVDIAMGHHKWYDDSRGYPPEFSVRKSRYAPIIDIVHISDCMDTATDSVGRSYKHGKTLDEFIGELQASSGTNYAPWAAELLQDPDVRAEFETLLGKGRQETYRLTYDLLKDLRENSSHILDLSEIG